MDRKTVYLETGSTDPYYNLAYEEYVLCHRKEGDYLILWQNDNTIVIGRNQNTEAEIDRNFVERNGVRVVRRTTGGGAVYHDLGNLNYSFVTDLEGAERFTGAIVRALREMGIQAAASGRNDILVDGLKVSGTAERIVGERLLHHGTLLFDSDLDKISGALHADPLKFRSKGITSVRSRVGNLRPALPEDMTIEEFRERLKCSLCREGVRTEKLTDEELREIERLRNGKYATWEWNFGEDPPAGMVRKKRRPGGMLEVRADPEGERLSNVRFFGDFLSTLGTEIASQTLEGCPLRREDIISRLEGISDLAGCFGTITAEEIADTILQEG
jgi:lipoate-protein ligase A